MDWIKKNFEKFSLLVLSVALLGVAIFLALTARNFLATFDHLKDKPFENHNLPPLDTKSIDAATAALDKPATWWSFDPEKYGSLFVSQAYAIQDDPSSPFGLPKQPEGQMWYPPVPNNWITSHHLNLLDPNILNEDSNGNGFTNLEKFKAGIDPTDKSAHPPYTTKLFLEKFIQVPFRLKFNARPDDKTYQIDTVDINQPTQILEMGDTIAGTKYKIVKFEEKHHTDESQIEQDDSELTIQNTETNAKVVLVIGKTVDDPDSYALFKYLWGGTKEIRVKLGANFSIPPETDVIYQLIEVDKTHAVIQNIKTSEKITIPAL